MSVNRYEKRSEEQGWGSPIFRGKDEETPGNAEREREQLERQEENQDRTGFWGLGEHRDATCWGPGSVCRRGTLAPHLRRLRTQI